MCAMDSKIIVVPTVRGNTDPSAEKSRECHSASAPMAAKAAEAAMAG